MSKSDPKKEIQKAVQAVYGSSPSLNTQPQSQPLVANVQVHQEFSRGPLPPPDMLKRYNEAVPGGAERIMAMAEGEQAHTHQLEKLAAWQSVGGTVGGFVICVVTIGGGVWLIAYDKSPQGLFSLLSGLGLLVGGYLFKRKEAQTTPRPPKPEPPARHQTDLAA